MLAAVYLEFLMNLGLYIVAPILICTILWSQLKVRPSKKIIWGVSGWVIAWIGWKVIGYVDTGWGEMLEKVLGYIWQYGLLFFIGLLVLDFWVLLVLPSPSSSRKIPTRFASGVSSEVEVKISNRSAFSMNVMFHDGLPMEAICQALPWSGPLPPRGYHKIAYPLEFIERGDTLIEKSYLEYRTLLGMWSRQVRTGEEAETKVYPNYEPIVRYALLTMESSPEQMGIVMKNRIGMSKEFHQLRDYHLGDMLSQIDWKASSKHRSLISRDYQEQKDQNVILVIDCGRRMRAIDDGIPQFDHCLNAMLLLSYVALKQGDHVGVLSFGGTERWLPPVKGIQSMTTLLNHLYDYKTSPSPSDFSEAAERLLTRQRRRSLVIVLTNVRGEDGQELIEPLRKIRQKHVVMVANLQEKEVMDRYKKEVTGLDDALTLGATQMYLDERKAIMTQLESHGISTVDAPAQNLPVALANRYLAEREGV
jgi:uncharacterized protein (DUF58 family)